jgi:hypothetical protein
MDTTPPAPDPVEQFLASLPVSAPDPAFRQELLRETLTTMRRQRWRRRAAVVGALAASFLAGTICMHFWPVRTPDVAQQEQASGPAGPSKKTAPQIVPAPPEATVAPIPGGGALAMEWNAFDERDQREKLYRQAGDLYVQENQDYEAALRCYAQALDSNANQDMTINADDNWLVMALKEARRKEQSHAKKDG